ncbi:MAG: hypothetical protein Q8P07_04685 [bacterium]|nr:hypothetical protein [bacterium]
MKGYLVLVGSMAESLADKDLFATCTPVVWASEEPGFNALIALKRFLKSSFPKSGQPTVSNIRQIEFYGSRVCGPLLPEHLKTVVDLSSGATLEIKVVQVKIEMF